MLLLLIRPEEILVAWSGTGKQNMSKGAAGDLVQSLSGSNAKVALAGAFDRSLCERLMETVRESPGAVEVDFIRVAEFRDGALGVLAGFLSLAGADRVILRGLGEHPRKILSYLSVSR